MSRGESRLFLNYFHYFESDQTKSSQLCFGPIITFPQATSYLIKNYIKKTQIISLTEKYILMLPKYSESHNLSEFAFGESLTCPISAKKNKKTECLQVSCNSCLN